MRNIAKAFGIAMMLVLTALMIRAQSQSTAPPLPQWQMDAGGKMAFDVASVKQDAATPSASTVSTNMALGSDDSPPTGGLFSATNIPLINSITFAYKTTVIQGRILRAQVPRWVLSERFDIQARAGGNPTKDQMRLMMQALLADRFKLAMHRETRQLPEFGLALDKPGKMGPQLQVHPSGATCTTDPGPAAASDIVPGGFPATCGHVQLMKASGPGQVRIGGRNVTLELIGSALPGLPGGTDRPVLDQTGLSGTFDFTLEWVPPAGGPSPLQSVDSASPPVANVQTDDSGPTFLEALKEQLGLKLESATGPVDVLVVDHIEEPSEN